MKKSADILGLPVISITEGDEIGVVKKLIINPADGAVAALFVDDGKWYLDAKFIAFSEIAGIGEYALTISSNNSVATVATVPTLEPLLNSDITVIGTKVLTKSGRIQGTVTELMIDDSGVIIACEVEELNGQITSIPGERIITFAKKVLVITDENEVVPSNPVPVESVPEVTTVASDIVPEVIVEEVSEVVTEISDIPTTTVNENNNDDSAKKFDEKQRKYLLGKKASRRIETANGVLIIEQGGEINEEILQKAKLSGKFVELSMNIQ